MRRHIPSTVTLLAAVLMTTFVGCGPKRPAAAPVRGKITFQGKPVTEGQITFHPEHGRPAIGAIGTDGTYRLTTFKSDDGAEPGNYRVTIDATRVTGGTQPKSFRDEMRNMNKGIVPKIERLVPEKYSRPETSPLTAEVKQDQNTIDFDIP